jgi:hypothetical protein
MRTRRILPAAAATAAVLLTTSPALADPVTDFEMPFPCGESWTGTTRDSHSPSPYAVDWNRVDDLYDPVVASAGGVVTTADTVDDSGYGRWVVIDHGNGEKSVYAHLSAVMVTVGQRVDQGAQIGTLGSTGNSSGPHLHYEQRLNSTVTAPFFHQLRYVFGTTLTSRNCVDVPLAPDWNGDGIGQPTVFRRASPATFRIFRDGLTPLVMTLGGPTDDPVVGDWDGNGAANPGVRTPGTRTFTTRTPAGLSTLVWGYTTDKPVAGDWDGDRKWELGLWRSSSARFILRSATGTLTRVPLGDSDDLPVTGDWDGDGITDLGVYDQASSVFTLRKVDDEGVVWLATVQFGTSGDLPVTGDWDGNLRTDLGTWTPTTATFNRRIASAPTTTARTVTSLTFGTRR